MKPTTNVMLDIETYGFAPYSVIKSIGAVKFAILNGKPTILDRFYQHIYAKSCTAIGLKMDPETVEWWMRQSNEARKEMTLPGEDIMLALVALSVFINDPEAFIWGNGAAFDNVLVACAYEAAKLDQPVWVHRKSLCYRTMKVMHPEVPFAHYKVGVHHNALNDAEGQALHLMAIQAKIEKHVTVVSEVKVELENIRKLSHESNATGIFSWGCWIDKMKLLLD